MPHRRSDNVCLFCGEEFAERGELFDHFGSRHIPRGRNLRA